MNLPHPVRKRNEVFVTNLEVQAHIGIDSDERDETQPLIIEIVCYPFSPLVPRDDLAYVIDYRPICEQVVRRAIEHKRDLIETFAYEVAVICFNNPQVESCTVSVTKPKKVAGANVGTVGMFFRGEPE